MAAIKAVILSDEPAWHKSKTIEAKPGEIELSIEGPLVHINFVGVAPDTLRIKQRLGSHVALARWDIVVFAEASLPASVSKTPAKT